MLDGNYFGVAIGWESF